MRDHAALKTKGKSRTERINPLTSTKSSLRVKKKRNSPDFSKTEGIQEAKISRRKGTGECLDCAWPSDRKGSNWVKECIRKI